ncbi:MAG: hypothetical protein DRG59_09125 [Deltaproteobacteria bacterium]|nr:MAG: hypothetical protein DRG59_09125 [Deltaproteobacteria bacterium]
MAHCREKICRYFCRNKVVGKCWYGFANGVVWPIDINENTVYPKVPPWPYDDRGWWSEDIRARIIFYDSNDLAAVARGTMKTYEPQPYASMDIDRYLFDPGFDHKRKNDIYSVQPALIEPTEFYTLLKDEQMRKKSLVHVWMITN